MILADAQSTKLSQTQFLDISRLARFLTIMNTSLLVLADGTNILDDAIQGTQILQVWVIQKLECYFNVRIIVIGALFLFCKNVSCNIDIYGVDSPALL